MGNTPKDNILQEARKLAVDSLYSEKGHFVAASRWRKANYFLGSPSALLAAIAGGGFLAGGWAWLAGLMSLTAACLTAISTFLNPSDVADRHHSNGVKYSLVRRRLRKLANVDGDLPSVTDEQLAHELGQLIGEVTRVQSESPPIPAFAAKKAKIEIDSGKADYTESELKAATG
jgi:hypothetical protein